ncbi:MAG: TetR family transcriptional regulator [Alphaproteobacteria bacterium]|nr:TetR family transcriptional regulator [Alphaproteobacteria bacterium]
MATGRRASPKRAAPRRQAASGDFESRVVAAALALAERQGWRRTTLTNIADEAGLSLSDLHTHLRSRGAILAACMRYFDQVALAGPPVDKDEKLKDRLFDLLMRRFEALKRHRKAIRSMARDSFGDPAALLALKRLLISMGWMLEAAGIPTAGLSGMAKRRILALAYLSVLVVFLRDETRDLGTTMAALDRRLSLIEPFLGL